VYVFVCLWVWVCGCVGVDMRGAVSGGVGLGMATLRDAQ
jgi:hypothetical protein